jgi:murein L,D-transpeptidase YcbB/YkuD
MYATAVVTKNGEVHFFQDIYEEDAALEKELAARSAHQTRSKSTGVK